MLEFGNSLVRVAVDGSCVGRVLVGSVLLQDEASGDTQTPVVINMDGADQRLAERQQQLHLIDEQVTVVSCFCRFAVKFSVLNAVWKHGYDSVSVAMIT